MPAARQKSNASNARVSSAPTTQSSASDSVPVTCQALARNALKEIQFAPEDQETGVQDDENVEDLAAAIAALGNNATESQDVVDEIRTQLHQYGNDISDLGDQVRTLVQALQSSFPGINIALSTSPATCPARPGTNPLSFIQEHMAWIDNNLVTSIVAHKLDPKELILLLSVEERPSKRGSQRSNLQYDTTPGFFSTVDEPSTAFEKDFPTIEYLVYAFSVYGAIKGLYDTDNTGIGPTMFLHIKRSFVMQPSRSTNGKASCHT
jgi:hypothetical protein